MFNAETIVCDIDQFHPGSTDYYMNLQKKPGFCFECGYSEDRRTQRAAEESITNFLIYYGCIKGKINRFSKKQKLVRIVDLYRNKHGPFKPATHFKDFEIMKDRTLIGFDGEKKVYVDRGKLVLFVRDRENINEECFLIGEKYFTENLASLI